MEYLIHLTYLILFLLTNGVFSCYNTSIRRKERVCLMIDLLSRLTNVRLLAVYSLSTQAGAGAKRDCRASFAIEYKYEGETVLFRDGERYLSNASNAIVLPKGSGYEWRCTQSGRCLVVEFDCEESCETPFSVPVKNGEKLLSMIRDLEYKRTLGRPLSDIESMRDLYDVLLFLARSESARYTGSEQQRRIALALDYIAKNYDKKIKNDELAAVAGVSTVYFRRLFTETVGQSPIDYVQTLRIGKAREMLAGDYGSVTDIAEALGYQSIYDFSRAFKKQTGVSPLAFRQRRRV